MEHPWLADREIKPVLGPPVLLPQHILNQLNGAAEENNTNPATPAYNQTCAGTKTPQAVPASVAPPQGSLSSAMGISSAGGMTWDGGSARAPLGNGGSGRAPLGTAPLGTAQLSTP